MANDITAFFERLQAASGEFNKAKVGTLGYLDSVYLDLKPEVARRGQTIRIDFPDMGAFTDQGVADWTVTEVDPDYVDVTLAERPGKAILARDFESVQTEADVIRKFLDPIYKRAQEYANGAIATVANSTNFNVNSPISTTAFSNMSVDDAANAWDVLVNAKVPITDPSDASLLYHSNIHRNMLTDATWTEEAKVGAAIAQSARTAAAEGAGSVAFNFLRRHDQQAPTGLTSNLTGTITVANGSASVTGSSTAFTTELAVGSRIQVGADTVSYRVKAIASNTALTLSQVYGGALTSGNNFKRVTYTSVAMHRHAIALAMRPLELVNDGHVRSTLVMLKGIPIRIMISYAHLKAGRLLTADFAMVAKVIRPDFGVIITS